VQAVTTASQSFDYHFDKSLRLLAADQYQAVFTAVDIKVACPQFLLLARFNQLDHPRLGLVIAKKQLKLATRRNRFKRLIRESFRQSRYTIPGMDIIVMARPATASSDSNSLNKILAKQWQRLSKRAAEQTSS
jgi:ribonuclease P protein component